jgi:hypothetical protein
LFRTVQKPTQTNINTKHGITRRHSIQSNLTAALAAGALPAIIPASAIGAEGRNAPGSRITVGCIGMGPQGRGDKGGFLGQKYALSKMRRKISALGISRI